MLPALSDPSQTCCDVQDVQACCWSNDRYERGRGDSDGDIAVEFNAQRGLPVALVFKDDVPKVRYEQ